MRRPICWLEKLEDGVKREVRVALEGSRLKWQFFLSTSERWDYDSPPTEGDWDNLLSRMEDRYQRRNVSFEDLDTIRRLRDAAR
jgi:hypothetical protein